MPAHPRNTVGEVYRCPVCGAEVSVISTGAGQLAPRCCNRPMDLLARRHALYFCPVCGAEIMAVRGDTRGLEPRCCNLPMVLRKTAA